MEKFPKTNNLTIIKKHIEKEMSQNDIQNQNEAMWLLCDVLKVDSCKLPIMEDVSNKQKRQIRKVLKERLKHKPLEKIFGYTEFFGEKFFVSKNVLSPRQETELVVENAILQIENNQFKTCLDLCCGSGIIAITIKKHFPDLKVFASDISKKALKVAMKNATEHNVKIDFVLSNMFLSLNSNQKYDIIISNPPYIKHEEIKTLDKQVRKYDPKIALDGKEDGLYFYKIIAKNANFLNQNGKLVLEIGYNQAKNVKKMLEENFEDINVLKDYQGNDRIIIATKRN